MALHNSSGSSRKARAFLPMTIASDDEVEPESESDMESTAQPSSSLAQKSGAKKRPRQAGAEVDSSFSFDGDSSSTGNSEAVRGWDFKSAIAKLAKQDPRRARTGQVLDDRIAAKRSELRKKEKAEKRSKASTQDASTRQEVDDSSNGQEMDVEEEEQREGERVKAEGPSLVKMNGDDEDEDEDEDGEKDDEARGLEQDALRELSTIGREKHKREQASKRGGKNTGPQVEDDHEDGDDDDDDETDEDKVEARKAAEFFEDGDGDGTPAGGAGGDVTATTGVPFQQLNLSRPLLRAVEAMGFVNPTPIQQKAVPFALAGRDVCASATTGSGKTAAFMLPILERLLYRPKKVPVTRVMVITPTRELGVQIHSMCSSLGQFTDIACALVVGGNKNLKAQEAELRARPDIVVCTPGRMVDHLTNSASVHMDDVEILVLDEADRLLELGFQDEVAELVKACPKGRQTLLFSATMNTKVDDLASLALNKPVRVRASAVNAAPQRLVQEFVRIRQSREQDREAIMLSLVARTFKTKTIVFFDTKVLAHRLNIVLGLAGIKSAELHGNLAMTQRLEALDRFKSGDVTVLVATDLAARGLDITGVHTVINFEMPRSAESYIHRVGRTARAGCGGRSVTLIGESRRVIMKEVLKTQGEGVDIKSRAVSQAAIDHFRSKIEEMETSVSAILADEKAEREARCAEMEADRAMNMVEHNEEIHSRPARQWIMSEQKKSEIAEASKQDAAARALRAAGKHVDVNTGDMGNGDEGASKKEREKKLHRMTRKKRRRILAEEADKREEEAEKEELRAQGKPIPRNVSSKGLVKQAKKEARATEKKAEDMPLAKLRGGKRELQVGRGSAFDFDLNARKEAGGSDGKARDGKAGGGKGGGEAAASRYKFTEFDPNRRLKRGAKKGSAKFKSKAKFKRKK